RILIGQMLERSKRRPATFNPAVQSPEALILQIQFGITPIDRTGIITETIGAGKETSAIKSVLWERNEKSLSDR
ncbi:MAG: hypothetical protein ACKOBW_10450, partial [Planctomycetota bacterium]